MTCNDENVMMDVSAMKYKQRWEIEGARCERVNAGFGKTTILGVRVHVIKAERDVLGIAKRLNACHYENMFK